MTEVEVRLMPAYKVYIGRGILDEAIGKICQKDCKVMVVTDSNVAPLHLARVVKAFDRAGYKVSTFSFEAGEASKTVETYLAVIEALRYRRFSRKDIVVALGGGVVGDIAGFAAATYMRGISVVQMPTTLLAMIDSSVGGKTGVDLAGGKNLLGAFHQPILVAADLDFLDTLPEAEWRCGIGEGIKYACLAGGELEKLLAEGIEPLERFVELCVSYKAHVVEQDQFEGGKRMLLNLGHTLGHALECASGYTVPHGVAVAKGVLIMARAALKAGELRRDELKKVEELERKYSFDLEGEDIDDLLEFARADKKADADEGINVVCMRGIGNCAVRRMSWAQFGEYVKA